MERNWIKVKLKWHTAVGVPHIQLNPSKSDLFNDDGCEKKLFSMTFCNSIRKHLQLCEYWFFYIEKNIEKIAVEHLQKQTKVAFFSALSCILFEKIW